MNDTQVSNARALVAAVLAVSEDLHLPDLLHRLLRSACELTEADYGALSVHGQEGASGEFFRHGDPLAQHERSGPLPTGRGSIGGRSFLGVAIRVHGSAYANLYLAGKPAFTPADEEAVGLLADAASAALTNAIRFDRTRQRELWLQASQDVTSALLSGAAPTDTLRLVAERARSVSAAAVTAIALPVEGDPDRLMYEVVDGLNRHPDPFTGRLVEIGGTASGKAFRSGRPVVHRRIGIGILDWAQRIGLDLSPRVRELDSTVFAPLLIGEHPLGVLVVSRFLGDPPFRSAEIELVQTFAGQAALVLAFAKAEEDRERLAVLSDRDRIARDLHDLVIQRLFSVGLGLQGLGRMVVNEHRADRVAGLVQDIDRTIKDMRNTIFSLQATSPGPVGLRTELLRVAHEAAPALGVEPRIGFDGPLESAVGEDIRPDLLATLREALSNVARHARASSVAVDVGVDPAGAELTLVVADNGIGLPKQPGRRSGLANMTDRATRWNGTFIIDDMPEGGTRLRWTVPLRREMPGPVSGAEQ
jgi:signal transduction histidine kinase